MYIFYFQNYFNCNNNKHYLHTVTQSLHLLSKCENHLNKQRQKHNQLINLFNTILKLKTYSQTQIKKFINISVFQLLDPPQYPSLYYKLRFVLNSELLDDENPYYLLINFEYDNNEYSYSIPFPKSNNNKYYFSIPLYFYESIYEINYTIYLTVNIKNLRNRPIIKLYNNRITVLNILYPSLLPITLNNFSCNYSNV